MIAKEWKTALKTLKLVRPDVILFDDGVLRASSATISVEYHTGDDTHLSQTLDVVKLGKVLAKVSPKDEVTIRTMDDIGGYEFTTPRTTYGMGFVSVMPLDYPEGPRPTELEVSGHATIPLDRVAFARSIDDAGRPHMAGVLLESDEEGLRAVATDGHRLALAVDEVANLTAEGTFLLPGPVVAPLLTLTGPDTPLAWGGGVLALVSGPWRVFVREEGAKFPPWRKVFPKGPWSWELTAPRADLLGALKRIDVGTHRDPNAVVTADDGGKVELRCENTTDELTASESGQWGSEGAGDTAHGVNLVYLREAVQHTKEDEVVIHFAGPKDAILVGDDNVVMPVRL